MSDDQAIALVWLAGGLVIVGAAIARRRLPGAYRLRMALLWGGIFAAAWGVASLALVIRSH